MESLSSRNRAGRGVSGVCFNQAAPIEETMQVNADKGEEKGISKSGQTFQEEEMVHVNGLL